jgi:hypothetical protein
MNAGTHINRRACPVCVAEVTTAAWEPGYQVHDPYARGGQGGTAVGVWDEVKWAVTPSAVRTLAPEFGRLTLEPCGHVLRGEAGAAYRWPS